MNLHLEIFH